MTTTFADLLEDAITCRWCDEVFEGVGRQHRYGLHIRVEHPSSGSVIRRPAFANRTRARNPEGRARGDLDSLRTYERSPLSKLRQRLNIKAYHRALHDLRDLHRDEFELLHDIRRAEVGVYWDGADADEVREAAR